ncbi:MAG: tRNA (adenosine(37)-N6)-threonylcarbamoyltransferase complex ATPase subunit type 1 TsaE [Clostridia bacterium]
MYKFISHSEDETKQFAYKLASRLNIGDIILLVGDLGAGKTKFTEGLLSFWNLQDEISSPTFTIVNEYNTQNINIYHFDVYRLSDVDEFFAIGGLEYFENGISIIEWGDIIEDIIPKDFIKITILKDENNLNLRTFDISPNSTRLENVIKELF